MPSSMPPAGIPYHRLTHHISRRRVLLTLLAVLIGTLVAPVPVALIMEWLPPDGLPVLGASSELVLSFAAIACILPTTLLIVRYGERRKIGTLSSVTGRLRWWWLALCLAIAGACIILALCLGTLTAVIAAAGTDTGPAEPRTSTWIGIGPYLTILHVTLALLVGQVAAEEYVTRGVILQAVGRFFHSPWPAISVQAVIFAALHGIGGGWWGTLGVLTVGVTLGWLTVHTGGLEAALGYHLAQNGLIAVVAVAAGTTDPTTNATTAPWPMAVGMAATVTTYALATRLAARALGITPPRHTSHSPHHPSAPPPIVSAPANAMASTNNTDASQRHADH
ncbi:lysostaphin resistance A-like protein [Micromonospora sp. NPDC049900]|uniref:lysostaphin resistance A-like protein n=1 Tax=Micromonospora sp. NPDC049900 TaxID=3364275 RepID=UPI0037A5BB3B